MCLGVVLKYILNAYMNGFVFTWQTTLKNHRNYKFYWKIYVYIWVMFV
jgi:hypothetical protein